MISFRYKNKVIPYVNGGSAIASGAVVILKSGLHGGIGIAVDSIAAGATGAVSVWDVHNLAALSTDTWNPGDRLYWDTTNLWLTAEATTQFAGFAASVKTSGQTLGDVALVGLLTSESAIAAALTNTSLTDSTGGTPASTFAADVATTVLTIPVQLADIANAAAYAIDVPFAGKLTGINFRAVKPASTAAKLATLQVQVAGTSLTGGVLSLTTAAVNAAGAQVAGTAITAGTQTFTANQTVGVLASSVTAFVEGDGFIELTVVNTDLLNGISGLIAQINDLTTKLRAAAVIN
jgi:predicted RecA/RadA family phage recombinase